MKNERKNANKPRSRHSRNAFTVAEVLMVLTIMVLLLSMSVAAYQSMTASKGIDGARKTIAGALSTARMNAMRAGRDVAAALSIEGAIDSGWVVRLPGLPPDCVGVINRMKRRTDTPASIAGDESIRRGWADGQFAPEKDKGYWACIVGGPEAGSSALIAGADDGWVLKLKLPFERQPRDNSFLCIVEGGTDTNNPPVIQQYKVSSDMLAGAWEALPKFVIVDGTYFPITFRADGAAAFPYDHAVIRLLDIRTSEAQWQWRMIVDRGSGACSTSRISPSDKDSRVEF